MELDLTESVEPSCQMLSACQLQCQWCNCCNWHASCMCHMIYNIYMPRKGTEWHCGARDSQVWCLRCLQNQAVTTRSDSSLGPNCAMRCVRSKKSPRRRVGVRSMNGDPYVWSSGGSGSFRFGVRHHRVWTSLAMMSLDAVLTYRMTHKLRTSQCVKMTAWEASGRCWDIEPGLTLNLGERSHDPIPWRSWSISPMGSRSEYGSNRFQYISRD